MKRLLAALLVLVTLTLLGTSYLSYSLFLQGALLKGAHNTLQGRYSRTQAELQKTRKALKQTRNQLQKSRQKLSKMESKKPQGARKLATRASKIPLLGTLPSIGLIAADLYDCYQKPSQCKEEIETLYEEGKALLDDE